MMRFFMVTATDSRHRGTEIEGKTHARIKEEARGPIQDGGTDHHTINANKYTWYGLFTIGKKWLQEIRQQIPEGRNAIEPRLGEYFMIPRI